MTFFNVDGVKELLSAPRNIVITTHASPDGDAIGSSLALSIFLKKRNHQTTVITPDEYPSFLNWLPEQKSVIKHNLQTKESDKVISGADLIFCLDFNTTDRLGGLENSVNSAVCPKILIDHHQFPGDWADFMFCDEGASSTAELLYRFIGSLGDLELLDQSIGECLYAGIVTDTGSFKFPSTSSETMKIAAELMELGVNTPMIQNLIYDNSSEDRLRLLGFSLTEKLRIFPEYHTAIITLSKTELDRYNYKTGDTEGIVNYPLSIAEVWMAVLITKKNGDVRMSFRSKGKVPVHIIAREHFSGGGHKNAAGGVSEKSVEETAEYLYGILKKYAEYLC